MCIVGWIIDRPKEVLICSTNKSKSLRAVILLLLKISKVGEIGNPKIALFKTEETNKYFKMLKQIV